MLALLSAAAVAVLSVCTPTHAALAPNFLYGAATAAYQIEGSPTADGKQLSEWDIFSHIPGKIANGDNGDIADMSYIQWQNDVALLQNLGVNSYRFSFSWSRIIDAEGNINQAGLQHYDDIVDTLLEAGITPFVTLYHWDLPLAFGTMANNYSHPNTGWLNASYIVPLYLTYADAVFSHFGARVTNWILFNEPHSFCTGGFANGGLAPGRCSDRTRCNEGDSTTEPYICGHTVLLAYSAAANLWRNTYAAQFGRGQLGMSLDSSHFEPLTQTQEDMDAAERCALFMIGWWSDPLFSPTHDYPPVMRQLVGSRLPTFTAAQTAALASAQPDFFGFNHYTSWYAYAQYNSTDPFSRDQQAAWTPTGTDGELIGEQAASSWLYVVPWGFPKVLSWISERYQNPLIFITENGVDVPGESQLGYPEILQDTFRINYLSQYLSNLTEVAVNQYGINVGGYFIWSLLDNFEWGDGFSKRFGLTYVDYKNNCTRYAKDSSAWYQQWIKEQTEETKRVEKCKHDEHAPVDVETAMY